MSIRQRSRDSSENPSSICRSATPSTWMPETGLFRTGHGWASSPTGLSNSFVPWWRRAPPADRRQTRTTVWWQAVAFLAGEILAQRNDDRGFRRTAAVRAGATRAHVAGGRSAPAGPTSACEDGA
jgi:hypothetical protein